MAERNPYIPAYVPEGSIRVSCIQHANVSTRDVKRSQEWYKVEVEDWEAWVATITRLMGGPRPTHYCRKLFA